MFKNGTSSEMLKSNAFGSTFAPLKVGQSSVAFSVSILSLFRLLVQKNARKGKFYLRGPKMLILRSKLFDYMLLVNKHVFNKVKPHKMVYSELWSNLVD